MTITWLRQINTVKLPVPEHQHRFSGTGRCFVCHKHMDDLPEVWS